MTDNEFNIEQWAFVKQLFGVALMQQQLLASFAKSHQDLRHALAVQFGWAQPTEPEPAITEAMAKAEAEIAALERLFASDPKEEKP